MSKSAKAKVDELFARESHHLREQNIHKIRAVKEVQLYGAERLLHQNEGNFTCA